MLTRSAITGNTREEHLSVRTFAGVAGHPTAQHPPEEQRAGVHVFGAPGRCDAVGRATFLLAHLLVQQLRAAAVTHHGGPAVATCNTRRTRCSQYRLYYQVRTWPGCTGCPQTVFWTWDGHIVPFTIHDHLAI